MKKPTKSKPVKTTMLLPRRPFTPAEEKPPVKLCSQAIAVEFHQRANELSEIFKVSASLNDSGKHADSLSALKELAKKANQIAEDLSPFIPTA